jgi:hypothetical protein
MVQLKDWQAGLLGGGVGFGLNKLFGGGDDDYKVVANRFGGLEKQLQDFYGSRLGQPGPTYPGGGEAAVAPLTPYENQSFDFLRRFGEGGFGQTFQNASKTVNNTLNNRFDPTSDPYYQAVKAESNRNLEEEVKQIGNDASGGGRYYTGARIAKQADARTRNASNLNTVLGGLYNEDQNRALAAVPLGLSLEQAQKNLPMQQAAAYQALGGLPRQIEQGKRDFDVNQWFQSQFNYPLDIANSVSGLLNSNQPVLETPQPGILQQLMQGLGQALPYLLMMG